MVVSVPVTDPAPIDDHRVVEQGAFAFLDRLQLLQDVGKLADVEAD